MKNYKIAVAGTGYVGLSLSVLLAQHNQVMAVDIVQAKVDMMHRHRSFGSGAFLFPRNEPKCVKTLVNRELSHILACSGRSRGECESAAATTIRPGGAVPISTSPLFI